MPNSGIYNENIMTVKGSWPASCLSVAPYHSCCQHNGQQFTTVYDGRSLVTAVDNTCSVMTLVTVVTVV